MSATQHQENHHHHSCHPSTNTTTTKPNIKKWEHDLLNLQFPSIHYENTTPKLSQQQLSVTTFNIRCVNENDIGNLWSQRKIALTSYIIKNSFDIVLFQEVKPQQLKDLRELLPIEMYTMVGIDRQNDGTGERCTIAYKPNKYTLLHHNTFWLCPEQNHQKQNEQQQQDESCPIKGWDAKCLRICTYGIFYDIYEKKCFVILNSHWDHIGIQAQCESPKLILQRAKRIQELIQHLGVEIVIDEEQKQKNQQEQNVILNNNGNSSSSNNKNNNRLPVPIIIGGDFNVTQESLPFKTLLGHNNDECITPQVLTSPPPLLDNEDEKDNNSDDNNQQQKQEDSNANKNNLNINPNTNNKNNPNVVGTFFVNTFDIAENTYNPCSTFNGWRSPPCAKRLHIDHLLLSSTSALQSLTVKTWRVCNDATYADPQDNTTIRYTSDHFPLHILLEWK